MSFFFDRAKRKGLAKRLRKALADFQHDHAPRRAQELLQVLNDFNETMNGDQFAAQQLPALLNAKLYRADTVTVLIEMIPLFDQPTQNAVSTLLQTTIREFRDNSLPQYLCANPEVFNRLISYFDQPNVGNLAHLLFRTCAPCEQFLKFVYSSGTVGSFTQYLSDSNFDRLATAFASYDALLTAIPDVSAQNIESHWEVFVIQFNTLLSSPNVLVQLNFLPILTKFFVLPECRVIFLRYINDVGNLQCVMVLLASTSKRVRFQAYSLFKLFVINPRKTEGIVSALKMNRGRLCKLLTDLPLEDPDPAFEEERRTVISTLEGFK
jgi:calcium binding protein 39